MPLPTIWLRHTFGLKNTAMKQRIYILLAGLQSA